MRPQQLLEQEALPPRVFQPLEQLRDRNQLASRQANGPRAPVYRVDQEYRVSPRAVDRLQDKLAGPAVDVSSSVEWTTLAQCRKRAVRCAISCTGVSDDQPSNTMEPASNAIQSLPSLLWFWRCALRWSTRSEPSEPDASRATSCYPRERNARVRTSVSRIGGRLDPGPSLKAADLAEKRFHVRLQERLLEGQLIGEGTANRIDLEHHGPLSS